MAKNTLSTVAVIGAGDMGHGIAEVALLSGFRVNLQDINDGALEKGTKRIFSSLGRLQEKGAVSAAKANGIVMSCSAPALMLHGPSGRRSRNRSSSRNRGCEEGAVPENRRVGARARHYRLEHLHHEDIRFRKRDTEAGQGSGPAFFQPGDSDAAG